MIPRPFQILPVALLAILPFCLQSQGQDKPSPLFDGKTLEGWDYDPNWWWVEDGVITGGSKTKKVPKNFFISTKKSYQNFELKMAIRCSGTQGTGLINSGIQVRSIRIPGTAHVAGYQVDCGKGWFGKIYDEHRRNRVIANQVDAAALAKAVDVFGWNEYRIRAEGTRIRVWINDVLATDFTEENPQVALDGVIAPQVHSGGIALVQFKDVSIIELPPTPDAPTWESLGGVAEALKKARPAPRKPKPAGKPKLPPAKPIPSPPKEEGRVNFDFETGDLQGWYIAEGWFSHLVTENKSTRNGGRVMNKEGRYYMGTLEVRPGGPPVDLQTGVIESPVFQLTGPDIQFAVSGGDHDDTYVALCTLDGKEVQKASAHRSEIFSPKAWNVPGLVGKPVFVRIVDKNKGPWGHIVLDAFSAQGKLLPDETQKRKALAKPDKKAAIATPKPRPGKKTQSGRVKAWSPEEQRAGFTVPPGFVVELVASEEHGVINPIDLAFDDAGRLWTQTAQMYPLDPVLGIKWGDLIRLMDDQEKQAENPQFKRIRDLYRLKAKGKDKILILDDPTKAASGPLHVWADGLAIPQSILPYKDGAYVCHGSELFLLRDTDGDGKSDKMEPVLSGFGFTDTHTMAHLLIRAPGNYIHFSQGALNKGMVTAVASGKQARVDACCQVRFPLDHQDFEVLTAGPNNMWGLQLRANGQWYGSEANDHGYSAVPWEHGSAIKGVASKPLRPYQPILPAPHKFRVGGTGLSGLEFPEDTRNSFPAEEWKDVALLANPITSTINAVRVHRNPDGTVEGKHLPDFLRSKDDWFRPVNLEFGPDGCLYVADFYNKIISHNEVSTAHPERDRAHGRIWRIRHKSQKPRQTPDVTQACGEALLQHLRSPHLWEKRAAWHQISDRNLTALAPGLVEMAGDGKESITTRIHALWSLEGILHFDKGLLKNLLASEDGDLRREAVRTLASFRMDPQETAKWLEGFLEDPNCMVRSQTIRTLSDLNSDHPSVIGLLIEACKPAFGGNRSGGAYERNFERFLARMALEKFPAQLESYLAKNPASHPAGNILWAIQALGKEARQKAFLKTWGGVSGEALDAETFVAIAGMLSNQEVYAAVKPTLQDTANARHLVTLALANQSRVQSQALVKLIQPLIHHLLKEPQTQNLGLDALGRYRIPLPFRELAKIPTLENDPARLRLLVSAMSVDPEANQGRLKEITNDTNVPFGIRVEAAHAYAPLDAGEKASLARGLVTGAEPSGKAQVANVFSQSRDGARILAILAKDKVLQSQDFDLSSAERTLQANRNNPQAQQILASVRKRIAEQRKQASTKVQQLLSYIQEKPGDTAKGKPVFAACLACHKLGQDGQDIAPPLDGSGHRDREHLLTAIVDPDAAVEGGYGLFRIIKHDNSIIEGYREKVEPLGTTVAMMGGARIFVPSSEIKKATYVGGRSFMPPHFGQLPEGTMADLVAYLATLKEAPPK